MPVAGRVPGSVVVAPDARNLLGDVGLDDEIAAVCRHDRHEGGIGRLDRRSPLAMTVMTSPAATGSVATSTRASSAACSSAGMSSPSSRD